MLMLMLISLGILMAIDSYMNLQMGNTEEYIDGELAGNLGEVITNALPSYFNDWHLFIQQVLIRCNNILYVREAPETKSQRA